MNLQRAVLIAGAASETQLREAYRRAVLEGSANTQCTARQERSYGTVRLLTLATLRLPDLTFYAHWAQICDVQPDARARRVRRVVLRAVADLACGALRLVHRALERHCHDLDDKPGAWVTRAIDRARQRLHEHASRREDFDAGEVGVTLGLARLAMLSLTRAIVAIVDDPRLVAEQLADGLADLFAVYLIARQAGGL